MPTPPPDAAPGVPDYLAYIFPQAGRRVRRASEVSRRTREREVRQYQTATGASRRQAQRRTAEARRRGQTFRVVRPESATPEQATAAERYRRRIQPPGRGAPPRGSFDDLGRITFPPQSLSADTKRTLAQDKVYRFRSYLEFMMRAEATANKATAMAGGKYGEPGEYAKAYLAFNEYTLLARIETWNDSQLNSFLSMSYEDIRAYVSAGTLAYAKGRPNQNNDYAFIEDWWYH